MNQNLYEETAIFDCLTCNSIKEEIDFADNFLCESCQDTLFITKAT
ncbi:MAG TPA: hypothetical protein VGD90_05715 [Sphingobacteriaceae bacterium]